MGIYGNVRAVGTLGSQCMFCCTGSCGGTLGSGCLGCMGAAICSCGVNNGALISGGGLGLSLIHISEPTRP
eukprot:3323418-Ditylum_brightwellii.AAC.1